MIVSLIDQMMFLFLLIGISYFLSKAKLIPDNSDKVLSKLENYLFIPALILGTFINNFRVDKLGSAVKLLLFSVLVEAIVLPIAIICSRLCSKDSYIRKIFLYGLAFSNFGFMGNAIVTSVFPEIFMEYVIFTMVLYVIIYLWGVPCLLANESEYLGNGGVLKSLKSFVNPMFICTLIGIVIGLSGIQMPKFVNSAVDSLGSCMSPVAMLITGISIAKVDIKSVLKIKSIYIVSALRLLVFPLIFVGMYYLLGTELPMIFVVCTAVSLSMPLGLNTVVIPSAYGKDTTVASGMALVSHLASILTIPLIFALLPI